MSMSIPAISPALRISFGLAMFTLSVLLFADLLGVIPKQEKILMESRQKVSESLAVQLSIAATTENIDMINVMIESFVMRNDDVAAAAMTKSTGEVITQSGQFAGGTLPSMDVEESLVNQVFVPIYEGEKRWGVVNIEFKQDDGSGLLGILSETVIGLFVFVFVSCLIGYLFILRKTLRVLDPKAVVPERVKSAFNALSEGVLLLDDKEQIMLVNNAFAEQLDEDVDQLIGVKASSLKLKHKKRNETEDLPWLRSIADGESIVGVPLDLSTSKHGLRSLSTNSAAILDEEGNTRGALVTFDDITNVEETNFSLEKAIDDLQKSGIDIKRKNKELEVLAARDSLTGCFNRRTFFDMFEEHFQDGLNVGSDHSCIMVDIDHFKLVNDNFGHAIGDEALRMISEVLNSCDYEGVVVGRYGGEEFCLSLPGADIDIAKDIAEELRKQIISVSQGFAGTDAGLTASFGVSCVTKSMDSHSILLEHADSALYTAKNTGRNRVVSWVEKSELDDMSKDELQNLTEVTADVNDNLEVDSKQILSLKGKIRSLEGALDQHHLAAAKSKYIDNITQLPTRFVFEDRIGQAIAYSERSDDFIAVMILNIDMFSRINNSLGQVIGDKFLAAVGHRLKSIMRRSDTVASISSEHTPGPSLTRLRDDEFSLLLTGFSDVESLTFIVKRIQEQFAGKITVAENEIYVTATIGMAISPDDGETAETLIENARIAQNHAKNLDGRNNYQFYSEEIQQKIKHKIKRELDIHNAIENDEFFLLYQPKLNLKSGAMDSMEALIRWNHPELGFISPAEFIPEAEEAGIIADVGDWCLKTVCQQLNDWTDQGFDNLRISVNISASQFISKGFVDNVSDILKQAETPASKIEIEVTESTLISDIEHCTKIIDELRFRDFTITLDDFGTGYSSFSYLGHMNLDWLKIDRSFLLEAMEHKRSQKLYSGIVKMAQEIGMKVVSEGIETKQEMDYVKALGVDEIQGYILHRPIAAASVIKTLFNKELDKD